MKNWIDTSWYYYYFELKKSVNESNSNNWSKGVWTQIDIEIKNDSLEDFLSKLVEKTSRNNYEIKSVIPLHKSRTYTYGQMGTEKSISASQSYGLGWGLGYGWGTSILEGVAVLLQKNESITDEEYKLREEKIDLIQKKKNHEDTLALIKKELAEVDVNQDEKLDKEELKALQEAVDTTITSKSKLFSGEVFIYSGKSYKSESEAFKAREDDQKKILEIQSRIENRKKEFLSKQSELEKQKANLENTIIPEIENKINSLPTNFEPQ